MLCVYAIFHLTTCKIIVMSTSTLVLFNRLSKLFEVRLFLRLNPERRGCGSDHLFIDLALIDSCSCLVQLKFTSDGRFFSCSLDSVSSPSCRLFVGVALSALFRPPIGGLDRKKT